MGFHSPLLRPAIYWGGSLFIGGTLDSHDMSRIRLRSVTLGRSPKSKSLSNQAFQKLVSWSTLRYWVAVKSGLVQKNFFRWSFPKQPFLLRRKRLQLNLFQLKGCQNFWFQKIALICGAFRKTEVCSSIAGCFHPSEVDRFTDLYRCPYGCGKVLDSFLAPWYRDLEGMVDSCGVPGFLQISICLKKWLIWAAWSLGWFGNFWGSIPIIFLEMHTIIHHFKSWWVVAASEKVIAIGHAIENPRVKNDISKSHGFEAQYYVKHGVSSL